VRRDADGRAGDAPLRRADRAALAAGRHHAPVTVLLALSRGLTLAEVGAVFVVHSVTVVLLELPTGGLADALGRRPVLAASGLLHLASCAAYATADGVPGFVLATFLLGAGRALDSGPLQAWYVDAVHQADRRPT
jgi:MFS family permease